MPCFAIEPPTLPVLPAPFSLVPPPLVIPGFSIGINICCIRPHFTLPPIPIVLPGIPLTVLNTYLMTINAAEQTVQAFLDEYLSLSLNCPGSH